MNRHLQVLLFLLFLVSLGANAQEQVRKEFHHKNVFENKYFRVLDVNIKPHDTTLFHIHSTPSVILLFTNTITASQIKGQAWVKGKSVAGSASYRNFNTDTLVHRVSNWDTVPYHVNDIELLSVYQPDNRIKPMPFTVLFDNEKAIAYRITDSSFSQQVIKNRGPIIAELVAGHAVVFHDVNSKASTSLVPGKYFYIEPGQSFYLSATKKELVNLVLFEIK
jgi:hypothetical protein